MIIQSDSGYDFPLPDEHAVTVIARIPDDDIRERILDAVDAAGEGEPVTLPVTLADALLNTFSDWEREEEARSLPIETTGKIKGTPELTEGTTDE